MTVREISEKYGLDNKGVSVTYKIFLLTLPDKIQDLLTYVSNLGERHGYELSKLCRPSELGKWQRKIKNYQRGEVKKVCRILQTLIL